MADFLQYIIDLNSFHSDHMSDKTENLARKGSGITTLYKHTLTAISHVIPCKWNLRKVIHNVPVGNLEHFFNSKRNFYDHFFSSIKKIYRHLILHACKRISGYYQ